VQANLGYAHEVVRMRWDITAMMARRSRHLAFIAVQRFGASPAVLLRELHHVERVKRRAFFGLAAECKYIQKFCAKSPRDGRLIIENPLVTANILVYLPKLIIFRGWDMRGEVDEETINEALFSLMQRRPWRKTATPPQSQWVRQVAPRLGGARRAHAAALVTRELASARTDVLRRCAAALAMRPGWRGHLFFR
jgi:hypothetical protein